MEWLLKIVEGPMKGAEIALIEGVPVSFGSGDDCDVIVQDATVSAKACEFEVDADGVRIAVGGGSSEPLPSFEIRSFGTTSFAVGPLKGEWQDLIKPVHPAIERADPEDQDGSPHAEAAVDGRANTPGSPQSESDGKAVGETGAARPESAPYRGRIWSILVIVLLLLAVATLLAWRFWPHVKAWYDSHLAQQTAASTQVAATLTLADIAKAHHLNLNLQPRPCLSGNLRRRTERLAIRALALAADPTVKFDLTDDETLLASSSELLFACSDGALKVVSATNRAVTVSGYAPSREALERAIRALNADVNGIDRLDTTRVRVGGTAPAAVAKTPFVREEPPGEHPVVAIPAHTPNPPAKKTDKTPNCPLAGILTVPYPCVVMRNGVRLVEGAQIGKAVLVKIEADKLTLNDGDQIVEWRP